MAGTGLALGGGGSKGAFQIGAWQVARDLDEDRNHAVSFVEHIKASRRMIQQQYEQPRQALIIDNKLRAIFAGRLKVLDLIPALRLSFLVELQTRIRHQDSLFKVPFRLFPNLNQAAEALLALDGESATGAIDPTGS